MACSSTGYTPFVFHALMFIMRLFRLFYGFLNTMPMIFSYCMDMSI